MKGCVAGKANSKRRTDRQLTLTIRCHMWHAGSLHHGCRTSSSHHGSGISPRKVSLGTHGKLLVVVHDLRLGWRWARLHVCVLLRGRTTAAAAERWASTCGSRNGIGEGVRGRIHGLEARGSSPG